MKNKIYKAFIINDNDLDIMIIDGYSKRDARKKLTSFYFKNNRVKDYKKFYIFLVRVDYIDGNYIDLE